MRVIFTGLLLTYMLAGMMANTPNTPLSTSYQSGGGLPTQGSKKTITISNETDDEPKKGCCG